MNKLDIPNVLDAKCKAQIERPSREPDGALCYCYDNDTLYCSVNGTWVRFGLHDLASLSYISKRDLLDLRKGTEVQVIVISTWGLDTLPEGVFTFNGFIKTSLFRQEISLKRDGLELEASINLYGTNFRLRYV